MVVTFKNKTVMKYRDTNTTKNSVAYFSGILLNCHKIPVSAILASKAGTPVYWDKFSNYFQCGPEKKLHFSALPQLFSPLCSSFLANWTANNWNANSGSWCPVHSLKGATQSHNNMTAIAQKRQSSAWKEISLYYWLQVIGKIKATSSDIAVTKRVRRCKEWLYDSKRVDKLQT